VDVPVMNKLAHSSSNKRHATFAKTYKQSTCQDSQKIMQLPGNIAITGAECPDLDTSHVTMGRRMKSGVHLLKKS